LIQNDEKVENNFGEDINIELKDHVEQIINSPKRLTMLNMFKAIQSQEHSQINHFTLSVPINDINEIDKTHKRRKKISDKKEKLVLKNIKVKNSISVDVEEWIKENVNTNYKHLTIPHELKACNKTLKELFKKHIRKADKIKQRQESNEIIEEQNFEPEVVNVLN